MLTKEEYQQLLLTLTDDSCDETSWYKKLHASHKIGQLIKEHFELVEHAKKLQDEVDKYKHEYFSMCDLVENPQPYKFEELKVGIWVWDKKYKVTNKIEELYKFGKQKAIRFSYLNEITQFGRTIEYEEDRFFPVTKALEYQK